MHFSSHLGRAAWGICIGLCACSAAGDGDSGVDRSTRGSGAGTDPFANAAGSGAVPTGAGDFGNSGANPAAQAGDAPVAGQECLPGEKCNATAPDEGCGSLTLEPDVEVTRVPGNILVVFDQSGSMDESWGQTTKLQAAQSALATAMMPLQDDLTAGAIFFPTLACVPAFPPPPGGAVAPITTAPPQFPFQPGPQFLAAWSAKFGAQPGGGIGTPLQEAFDRADVALANATLTGNVAVILFTDGQPNCFPDPSITMTPTDLEVNRAAAWLVKSVKTYVVGLPGGAGVQVLNNIAVSGGTTQYITPDDPATLAAQLKMIVEEAVSTGFDSCEINLDPPAEVPDKLHIVVEEGGTAQDVPRDLGNGAGWTVSADGSHVTLMGGFCDNAQNGDYASIRFEFGCVMLPPLPPIPPPQ